MKQLIIEELFYNQVTSNKIKYNLCLVEVSLSQENKESNLKFHRGLNYKS